MRQLHGEFVPLRLWPPAPIARCLAVPEVDGNRVARRRPNDGPRLSKRSTNAGGVADLLKSVATALDAVGSAFVQALTLRRGG
jgi:hypothetical protein